MSNEILLIVSLVLIYSFVLLAYYFFDVSGLYGWTVFCTITANIEVLLMVKAFGMEQTLGNVLFASSFLVTDIISEVGGKKQAQKAVNLGICTSCCLYWFPRCGFCIHLQLTTGQVPRSIRSFPTHRACFLPVCWFTRCLRNLMCGPIINGGHLPQNGLEMRKVFYGCVITVPPWYRSF